MDNTLIVILGPTGIGKSTLAIEIAKKLGTAIVSADSRQIYKEMAIGTAVPSADELKQVPHYFIQTKSIREYYNASMFEFEVLDLLKMLFKKNNRVLMVGGSGMYIDAVCQGIDDLPTVDLEVRQNLMLRFNNEGLESLRNELRVIDPVSYSKIDLKNPKRILKALEIFHMTGKPYSSFLTKKAKKRDFNICKIGLQMDREKLYDRINARVDAMLGQGLVNEAKSLYKHKGLNALNTVGYKELFDYFEEKTNLDEAIDLLKRNTRHYARKQITWFNRYKDIYWFKPNQLQEIMEKIEKL